MSKLNGQKDIDCPGKAVRFLNAAELGVIDRFKLIEPMNGKAQMGWKIPFICRHILGN
jgi:hypothetical protein